MPFVSSLPSSTPSGSSSSFVVSSDGYPYTYLPIKVYPRPPEQNGWANLASTPSGPKVPVACAIERAECFNINANEPAVEMLKRIMVDKPQCGDCSEDFVFSCPFFVLGAYILIVISALIGASGSIGLAAFLPPPPSSTSPRSFTPSYLPLNLAALPAFPYPANPYLFSLRLIQRYSYVLGGTPSLFFGVKSAENAKAHLTKTDSDRNAALVCINDDLASTDPKMVGSLDAVLRDWMLTRWPDRMEIEKLNEDHRVCD